MNKWANGTKIVLNSGLTHRSTRKMSKMKNPYLQILKESLIEFDKMTVHKGPVDNVVSYDGKGELDHHKPVKDVVSILERMYFQEDDESNEPSGWGPGRDKDAENSESDEQDLGTLGTLDGDGNSSEASSGGAGTLPNGSQPEGAAANAMDANDATSASRETAEVFKESVELFEDVLQEMESLPNVETGENDPQGESALDGDTPALGDYETETDYTGGHDDNKAENLAPKHESLFEDLWEDGDYDSDDDDAGDGGTAVLPKPAATVGDDDAELFSADEDEDSMEPSASQMEVWSEEDEEGDEDSASMNSEPEGGDAGGEEAPADGGEEGPDAEEEPLEVPAAGSEGDAEDESPEEVAEYGTRHETDDTGQDPGGSGLRPEGGGGGSSYDEDHDSVGDYDPVGEMEEEPVGDSEMDLPDDGPENAVGGQGSEFAEDDDDAPNIGESFFEDGLFEDTDVPGEVDTNVGKFYAQEGDEEGDAEVETDNGSTAKPEDVDDDEEGDAKMEGVIIARKQVEESIVERLIREMQSYQDVDGDTIKESFDDLDDMSLEDMFQ